MCRVLLLHDVCLYSYSLAAVTLSLSSKRWRVCTLRSWNRPSTCWWLTWRVCQSPRGHRTPNTPCPNWGVTTGTKGKTRMCNLPRHVCVPSVWCQSAGILYAILKPHKPSQATVRPYSCHAICIHSTDLPRYCLIPPPQNIF